MGNRFLLCGWKGGIAVRLCLNVEPIRSGFVLRTAIWQLFQDDRQMGFKRSIFDFKGKLRYFYIIYKPLHRAGCSGFFAWIAPSQALPRQLSRRESQAVRFITKVLGTMRKLPAVLLPLPLGELSPQVTERAHAVSSAAKVSSAMRNLSAITKKLPLRGSWQSRQALTEGVQLSPWGRRLRTQ